MLGTKEKVLDDIAQLAGGTLSVFSGLNNSIREEIKSRVDEMAAHLDLVPREDLDALEQRIEALEKQLNAQKKNK
ncbi:MAG: accessory factor UbiK family protein [Alphaproteobacteria bacterium]